MGTLLAVIRLFLLSLVVVLAAVGVLLAWLIPFKIRRARPALLVICQASRLFTLICNIRIRSDQMDLLRSHEGFIFLNHLSFIEPLVLMALTPCRFLAAVELKKRPVIGWLAEQVGTIFVVRESRESRRQACQIITKVLDRSIYPPTIVFPEGKLGLGDQINPFRYGIFETAIQGETPYLICALWYNRPDIAIWRGAEGERMLSAIWRLATFPGPLVVELTPLDVVHPTAADSASVLARSAQEQVAAVLDLPTPLE